MTFADVGAGTGFFAREASTIVGPKGRVLAVEMSAAMIDQMNAIGVPTNMQIIQSTEYSIPVDDSSADLTWISFVTHETSDVPLFVRDAARITKEGGKIVIVDWKKQDEERGPAKEERLSQEELKKRLMKFKILEEGSLNPSHYYFVIEVRKP